MKPRNLPWPKQPARSGTAWFLRTARALRLLLLLLTLPAGAQHQFNYFNYFNYITTRNFTVTIIGYTGPGGVVVIPDTIYGMPVTTIGNQAFASQDSLTAITIPSSVTDYIGESAFQSCTNLVSVTIPGRLTIIGSFAFAGCTSLASVTIPRSVTSIGNAAFSGCTSLTAITVDADNSRYANADGVLFDKSRTTMIQCPGGKTGDYTIPSSVTNIWGYAFAGCTSLASVTIPSSVTSIGNAAFSGCTSLASVTIGSGVTSFGNYAFSGCARLTSVTISGGVTSIGHYAFSDCTSLASVTIPSSVTGIPYNAFSGCTSLTAITVDVDNSAYGSVDGVLFYKSPTALVLCPRGKTGNYTIPSNVTSIGDFAFEGCSSLTSIVIPSSVTRGLFNAFRGCTSLTAINVDADNSVYSSVDGVLFNKNRATLFECPEGKTGNYTIPSSVTNIFESAFQLCANLASVTIPCSVTGIGNYAFWGCTSLTSVTFPSSVTSIGGLAFSGCTSLTAITVDVDNCTYGSVDGVLFKKSQTALILCPQGKTWNYTIPGSVTNIGIYAFVGCTSLTSVTIPGSVTRIEDRAFYYCSNLNGVYFQGNAPFVGSLVFEGTTNAIVSYLGGTTGWGPTFGGRPTARWKLQVQADDTSFGVRTNQFGFNISWASGRVVVVEACTDLAQPIWTPVGTNTLTAGSSYFSDSQWTNHPSRFYRLRSP